MIDKIRRSLKNGLKHIRWITLFLVERTKAETSIVKLMYESSKLEEKLDDLYKDIGKRALELREKGEESIFSDFIVQHAIAEINDLREAVNDYKAKAKDYSKIEG